MASVSYKGYPDPSRIIAVEEALGLLGDKNTVFVDTRNYWKYTKGHIPGAVNIELYAFHWFDTSNGGLMTFAAEMSWLFGAYGIDRGKQVVFYSNDSGYDAARGVWMLEFLGNRKGRMLDGGLKQWKRRKGPLSEADPEVVPARFVPKLNLGAVCGIDELSQSIGRGALQIVDVRSRGEYDGTYRRALRGGHIPGAVNIEWDAALRRDGTLKDARQLKAVYGDLSAQRSVVTYCQSGFRASHAWLVLRLLGFKDARNYLGSWYEWGNRPETRVEK